MSNCAVRGRIARVGINLVVGVLAFGTVFGAGAAEAPIEQVYMRPPEVIAEVVDAPFTPTISVSPDKTNILILTQPGLPGIDEVSQPELRIAGLRINPRNFGPSRTRYSDTLALRRLEGGDERPVSGLPAEPKINTTKWSPDGKHIAMLLTSADRIEVWILDVATAAASRLLADPVNDTYSNTIVWTPDSRAVLVTVVPDDLDEAPAAPTVPAGPVIQENLGRKAPARTYQDLLKNKHDESTFTYFATSQLVRVALDGVATKMGSPGIIDYFNPSPDGKYVLVQKTVEPFSYTVPAWRFPVKTQVLDQAGKLVRTVAELPLADDVPVPFGSVRTGPRIIDWRDDADSTLVLVEALDGGDAGADAELRDRVSLLAAPFDSEPRVWLDIDIRFSGPTGATTIWPSSTGAGGRPVKRRCGASNRETPTTRPRLSWTTPMKIGTTHRERPCSKAHRAALWSW